MTSNTLLTITSLHAQINKRLEELIARTQTTTAPLLYEGASYALSLPSKRLRPLLLLNILQDYKIPISYGLDAACALEIIHTYSLIHDDLPCMDNDNIRRGQPTLHTIYGEGAAMLIGNFLLTYAFEVLAQCKHFQPLLLPITQACGHHGMIGGQMADIISPHNAITWEVLIKIYEGKTAALFSAALECGALLSQLEGKDLALFKNAGILFGIAFQIDNDLKDSAPLPSAHTETTPLIKDKPAHCLNLLSYEQARTMKEKYQQQAINQLPSHCLYTLRTLNTIL